MFRHSCSLVVIGLGATAIWWWRRRRAAARITLRGLGMLQGEVTDGVTRFLGVPFAAAKRWRVPAPPCAWTGVRLNPKMLPRCPQPPTSFGDPQHTLQGHQVVETEDCLVLNCFTPDADPVGPLAPIVFYIHGGAGKLGDCHKEMFSGQALARQQRVCYFACNYRLGACARCLDRTAAPSRWPSLSHSRSRSRSPLPSTAPTARILARVLTPPLP